MFNRIIDWSLRNRGAVILLYVALTLAAIFAARSMAIDVFPEFAPPQVQIQTEASGFSSRDVESLVTRPIELFLQGAPEIAQIRSNSSIGLSRITIVFRWGLDPYRARQIVQERLQQALPQLPSGVSPPQLMPVTSAVSWLLKFALVDWSGTFREHELRSLVDWDFRTRVLAQPGIASMVAVGGGVKQYRIMIDPLRMRKLGVSIDEALAAQRNANSVAAGGFVYPTPEEEYFVRADGLSRSLDDIGNTLVAVRDGQPIRLADIAEIDFGSEPKRGDAQIYGGPAVIATVSKLWGADTLESTRNVESVLRDLARSLPPDVELIPNLFRQASFIDTAIRNLKDALIHSSLIVLLVLLLFLFRWKPTAISLIAIPTSLLTGVLVLYLLGVGINALTLGGLIFAIGEVVDDAIIDVENIMRRLRENQYSPTPLSRLRIVFEGSSEIRNSVVFATLVIALAFMPIFFLHGIEGKIFQPLAIAYLAAIGSSLVVALTLVPVLSFYLLGAERDTAAASPVAVRLSAWYQHALAACLRRPKLVAGLALLPLLLAIAVATQLGRSFIPAFNEGNIVIATTLMPGTSLKENLRVGQRIEQLLGDIPEIERMAQRAGRSRLDEDAQPVNFSEFDITLKPGTRDIPTVIQKIRTRLAEIPGMTTNVSQFITHRMAEILSGARSQVALKIFGQDFDALQKAQQAVYAAVKDVPGIVDLQMEPLINVPGISVRVDRNAAAVYGLTPARIVSQVGAALNGVASSKVLEHDRAFDIFLRLRDEARETPTMLASIPLMTPSGAVIPLADLARIEGTEDPYMINRDGGARRAIVQWNVAGRDLNAVIEDARQRISSRIKLPPGYTLEFGGEYAGQQRATRTLLYASLAAVLLILAVMFQAFHSWRLVALVMLNLPFALIGGVFALWLAEETLNVASLIGLIALFGIATRNSILLVSRLQTLARENQPSTISMDLIVRASTDRLLPIVMTASATALAVIPLLLGDPAGKELERPLAIVLLGGMFSSTLLNLFVVPAFFSELQRRKPITLQTQTAIV